MNTKEYRKLNQLLKLIILLAALTIIIGIANKFVKEIWKSNRNKVACIPADKPQSYPIIHYMPSVNSQNETAKLYTFIEQYIHLTQNESIIDFHKITDGDRYKNDFLSSNIEKALQMSQGNEKAMLMIKYKDSSKTFQRLKKCNCGWVFNIDAIESINRVPNTGVVEVTVLGEFQVTYDKVKVDLPHELWGYRRIFLTIMQDIPSKDSKDEYLNETGLFVIRSGITEVSYDIKKAIMEKESSDRFYVR